MVTLFYSVVGHFLYYNNRGRNEHTTFNWVGVSPSNNLVTEARNLPEGYAFELPHNDNLPIPTHFTRTSFNIGVFDNGDYSGKPLLAGTDSKHYA